jgi:hypothetical protein
MQALELKPSDDGFARHTKSSFTAPQNVGRLGSLLMGWLLSIADFDTCSMTHRDVGWSKSHPPHQQWAVCCHWVINSE